MELKVLHIVGDRFAGFAHENPEEVVTLSQLERMLEDGEPRGGVTLLIGQGIADESLRRLRERVARVAPKAHVELEPLPGDRANSRLTHKHLARNILISVPEQVVEGERYVSRLMLDDQCAEMSDHVTGQHLQGMVLIEAARQMILAVTERFFLKDQKDRSHYFVLNQLDTSFHAFGFPLGADVEYRIMKQKEGSRGSLSFEALASVVQGGELLTETRVRFSVYDASFLQVREAEKARQAIARAMPSQSLPKTG